LSSAKEHYSEPKIYHTWTPASIFNQFIGTIGPCVNKFLSVKETTDLSMDTDEEIMYQWYKEGSL
jgi:hypothetical protein